MSGGGQSGLVPFRLLVVDDEANQREMLRGILGRAGYQVAIAADGNEALTQLDGGSFDLVLTDQRMPGMDGLTLLRESRRRFPEVPVVLMTAFGSVQTAVEAMKHGAADYITKPFEREELILVLERVRRQRQLEKEVEALHGTLRDRYRLGNIIGNAPAMQEVFSLIDRISHTDVPVLIGGESGTGKELVARAIHEASARRDGPFVALNCAAVPENLLESEFFGHERGAFTGAVRTHAGKFEQAHGGTLLLDEIGAMRIDLQAKLLRAIQEREVQRVGGTGSIKVDVRILAASCDDLEESIRQKTFREDLFYRLNVVPVVLPPLRERAEDVSLLVDHFVGRAAEKFSRPRPRVTPEVLERLAAHHWPGNVRELENVVERMVLLSRDDGLGISDLPPAIREGNRAPGPDGTFDLPPAGVSLPELERHLIVQALERTRGVLGPAARLLGISYKTLQYRVRKYGLDREGFSDGGPIPANEAE